MKDRCILLCHDRNHNGDESPGQGCGNVACWKHQPGKSPAPAPYRADFRCKCPIGTFVGEEK